MAHDPIDVGDALRLTVTFTNRETGAPADPDDVALMLEQPDGTSEGHSYPSSGITRFATGVYEYVAEFDIPGTWRWRWAGTGIAAAVDEGEVYVRASSLAPPLVFTGIVPAQIRARSRVDFSALDVPFDAADFDELVAQAAAAISEVTGRVLDATLPVQGPNLVPMAGQAVRMRTEQLAFQAQPDNVEVSSDETLSSFSAGGYSEQRAGAVRPTRGGAGVVPPIFGWPALDHLAFLMMTDDKREFWRYEFGLGTPPPFSMVSEVNWSGVGNGVILGHPYVENW